MYPSPADARRNPFAIDGTLTPQARCPLAILDAEREEVDDLGVEALLARAIARRAHRPEDATVYGRTVSIPELEAAADLLRDPKRRILAELTDPWVHEAETDDLTGAVEALARHADRQAGVAITRLANPALVVDLLLEALGPPPELADRQALPPLRPLDPLDLIRFE